MRDNDERIMDTSDCLRKWEERGSRESEKFPNGEKRQLLRRTIIFLSFLLSFLFGHLDDLSIEKWWIGKWLKFLLSREGFRSREYHVYINWKSKLRNEEKRKKRTRNEAYNNSIICHEFREREPSAKGQTRRSNAVKIENALKNNVSVVKIL